MAWSWGPFGILARHEKRLDSFDAALKAQVSSVNVRLDVLESNQRSLSTHICNHKDENARQLRELIGAVADVKSQLEGDIKLKFMKAVTVLIITLTVGVICWRRPDSLPYIARIVESAMSHSTPGRQM